ncbi:major facilitator superfamily domain containing 2A [Cricetulus griseus]
MAKGEGAESGSAAGLLPTGILQASDRPVQVKVRSREEDKGWWAGREVATPRLSFSPQKEPKKKQQLSICNKLCYAVGGAPYQLTGCALGFFLQIYLLDVAKVEPLPASIILFVGRAWDAFTDPLVGFCISKSSWTRLGRLMPWIIFSTPLAIIAYFLIWFVPDFPPGMGRSHGFLWYLLFYCLFETLVTCFHVPYSALTMFISTEQSERDSATAYRMTVEVLGTVIGTAIQGQIVGQANAPCFQDQNGSAIVNRTQSTTSLKETQNAYLLAAGIIASIYVICAIILALGVREQRESYEAQQAESMPFFQGLRLVMSHGPYVKLIAGFLFTSLAFMLVEGNFALFCTYTLGFRNEFQNLLLAIMHPNSPGTEPIFFSFYVFFTKFASGVSLGVSTLSLDFAEYQTQGCSQPEQVKFTLKMLVTMAPIILILLGLLLFKLYPIDEEKRRQNKKALQALRLANRIRLCDG